MTGVEVLPAPIANGLMAFDPDEWLGALALRDGAEPDRRLRCY